MKVITIRQALQSVVNNPVMKTDEMIDKPIHELVCRTLFELANGVSSTDKRSMARANVARKMIFDRLVGRRGIGTPPATDERVEVEFANLIGGELDS
jgi:hypothetical protein